MSTLTGRIQIFAKAPLPGLAKSRLIPALGAEKAASLQAHFIHNTLTITRRIPLPTELWCTPDIHHPAFTAAANDFSVYLYAQKGDDLGARMNHAFARGIARGGPVVLIGSDCPALGVAELHAAFKALASGHDVVFGPSADGGYYLLGLNNPCPRLFDKMPWSTPQLLAESRARLAAAGLRWHELQTLHDIDTPADLIHLPERLQAMYR